MICDDVLELLTLPAEGVNQLERDNLQRHLDKCVSCARLAEAISPAVELFAQAADEYGQTSVAAAPQIDWLAETSTSDSPLALRLAVRTANDPSWQAMRLAVTLMIGVTLGGLLYGRSSLNPTRGDSNSLSSNQSEIASLSSSQFTRAALESLSLTEACLPGAPQREQAHLAKRPAMPAWELLAQAHSHELACCTHCHSTLGSAAHERDAIAQVARSCQTCHLQ